MSPANCGPCRFLGWVSNTHPFLQKSSLAATISAREDLPPLLLFLRSFAPLCVLCGEGLRFCGYVALWELPENEPGFYQTGWFMAEAFQVSGLTIPISRYSGRFTLLTFPDTAIPQRQA